MKKLLVCLLVAWFFLGRMTLQEWEKIADAESFVRGVGFTFSQTQQCTAEIKAMTNGEEVVIVGKCLEGKTEI